MKIAKEIWIGLTFIVALSLFIWGINFLKGSNIFVQQRTFFAVYERVDGLGVSSPVTLNGLRIGQVGSVEFMGKGSKRILVELNIDNPVLIPINSLAVINSADILGSKEIAIHIGNTQVFSQSGDTLMTAIEKTLQEEVNRQVAPLKKRAEDLMLSLDSMIIIISEVFNNDMRAGLTESLNNIQLTIKSLKNTTYSIDTLVSSQRNRMAMIIGNVESITSNLKNNNETITAILTNLGSMSDSLAKADIAGTVIKANAVLNDVEIITNKINKGEGTIGMLLKDEKLYFRLENSARDLDLLLQDVRLNPHRYLHFSILGRSPKSIPYTAPDSTIKQ